MGVAIGRDQGHLGLANSHSYVASRKPVEGGSYIKVSNYIAIAI